MSKRILGTILLVCVFAPLLATHPPRQTDLGASLQAPSSEHWLGTDLLGRDIYSRLLYGGRQTLLIASGATGIAIVGGLILGLLGSTRLETPIGILLDALLAIPGLLIALVMITVLDKGIWSVMVAVGMAGIAPFGRTTRDALHTQKNLPYVESAISIGASEGYILLHHLLRNARPILQAFAGVIFSWSLLNGAALAFLGFVGDISAPDWGVMLAAGRQTFATSPYEALAAGVMLTLTVGAVNRISAES